MRYLLVCLISWVVPELVFANDDILANEADSFDEYDEKDFDVKDIDFLGWFMVPHPDFADDLPKLRYFGGIADLDSDAPIVLKKASGDFATLPKDEPTEVQIEQPASED